MSSNPNKKAVQKMIAIAKERANGDETLLKYLLTFARESMGATAFMRKVCSFTEDDWELYQDLRDYELIKNRTEDDKAITTPWAGKTEDGDDWSQLTEEQFNQLARMNPRAKRLNFRMYQGIRFDEWKLDFTNIRCPIGY